MTWWTQSNGDVVNSKTVTVLEVTGSVSFGYVVAGFPGSYVTEEAAKEALRQYTTDPDVNWALANDGQAAYNLDVATTFSVGQEFLPSTKWVFGPSHFGFEASGSYDTKEEAQVALAAFFQAWTLPE